MPDKRTHVQPGDRFGRLVVLSPAPDRVVGVERKQRERAWNVVCDCGVAKCVLEKNLVSGSTISCGCKRAHRLNRHKPTLQSWRAMLRRCNDPKFCAYPNYGGRGIKVCREWSDVVTGYDAFMRDMGERPSGTTIDRKRPEDDYGPKTCRWSPKRVQEWNKRGRTMSEEDAAEEAYWTRQELDYYARLNREEAEGIE